MIQRIQTVYLLLVVALLVVSMFAPLGFFVDANGLVFKFKPLAIELYNSTQPTWGLFGLLVLSTVIALATIFLYKNRILQMRLTIFNSIVLIGFYISFLAFYFALKSELSASFRINWTLCLPLIAIIFNYLAIRAIGKDEVLVKAADRLR